MKHIRNYHLRTERWKDVKGYEGLYQVSNKGNVKSLKRTRNGNKGAITIVNEKLLKFGTSHIYCYVTLCKDGVTKQYRVHRLVAEAFIPNPHNKPQVDHINTIKNDNVVWNLKWVLGKEQYENPLTIKHLSECQRGEKAYWYGKKGKEHPECKPVSQFDLNGNLIKEWDCIADANRYFNKPRNASQIVRCCNGIRKTAYGYIWKYKSDILKENNDPELN